MATGAPEIRGDHAHVAGRPLIAKGTGKFGGRHARLLMAHGLLIDQEPERRHARPPRHRVAHIGVGRCAVLDITEAHVEPIGDHGPSCVDSPFPVHARLGARR